MARLFVLCTRCGCAVLSFYFSRVSFVVSFAWVLFYVGFYFSIFVRNRRCRHRHHHRRRQHLNKRSEWDEKKWEKSVVRKNNITLF